MPAHLWGRASSGEDKKRYQAMPNVKDRAAFRLAWAERRLTELRVSKNHSKEWRRADTSRGSNNNFAGLAMEYGFQVDPRSALLSAKKHSEKAVRLGWRWRIYDDMSEQLMFLSLQREYEESFAEAWKLYTTYHVDYEDTKAGEARQGETPQGSGNMGRR